MSTGASSIQPGKDAGSSSTLVEYNRFIDKQLRRTRAQVRLVDLVSGLLILATGSLAYFFALALIDHWAISGGLPGWARLIALGIYLLAAGWYLAAKVLPLLFWRINPLYAAETIERTQPSLKNSLLNFLIFRAEPQALSRNVYQAIEEQAATKLARVPIDNVVDRSKLIHIGYVLAGVLALCALYKVLSPKDPITSFGRMVMPWADILPPTRTSIESIEPGNTKAFRGQQVKISAEVRGLERDGEVTLYYTTADGQTVDRPIRMHLPQDGYRHICNLPPDDDGIQQTVQYRIVAGDARTRDYTIHVIAAPTMVVDSVEYVYPDYTGLSPQSVAHAGDIKALEGTRVTIHSVANQPIKDGGIDFECDGREELPLVIDGTGDLARGGAVSWMLSLAEDRATPTYTSYQLHFRNADGDQNLRPIRHTIETIPDVAPEIEFLSPKAAEVRVREGDVLPIELTASDPDFALHRVRLLAETDGRKLINKSKLNKPHRGQFTSKHRLSTKDLGLKAGDIVEYWAVAEDVKSPEPNLTITAKRKFQVVPRDAKGSQQDPQDGQQDQPPMAGEPEQPPKNQGEQGEQGESQQGDEQSQESDSQPQDQGQEGGSDQEDKSQENDSQASKGSDGSSEQQKSGEESSESKQDESQQGEESQKGGEDSGDQQGERQPGDQGGEKNDSQQQPIANDGTQDGDALEKILNHRQEQQPQNEKQDGQQQPPEQNQPGQDQTGSQKSPQENKQTGGNQGGQEKPNDKQANPENTQDDSGEATGNERKGEEQPSQTPHANAQKKEGEQGGQNGAEQKGNPQDDAKAGDNSQQGEATDQVGDQAKEEWGKSGGKGQQQKASEQDKQHAQEQEQQPQDSGDNGKSGSNSGNQRDQQPGAKSNQSGSGEHSKGDDQSGQKPNPGKKPDQSKGGSDEQEKGESGAGRSGGDEQGSPESQGDGRQRNKQKKSAGQQDDESKQEAQSPSNSNRESDSNDGQSEGDRSGAGKQGGGQKANQPGSGGAGKNTSADEGAGQSDEQGDGLESGNAGSQKEADGQTGQSGDGAGNGSQSRSGDQQSQGEQGKQPGDQPPSGGKPSDQKNNSQAGPGDGSSRGAPQGGGSKGAAAGTPEQQAGREPGGDAANLEYTRKATDLALQHLRDQLEKGEPDQDLLDDLGWTREDLEKFLHRWQQMKAAAREDSPQAQEHQRELDDTLRSLGLRPRSTTLGGNRTTEDTQRNLKESRRSSPPAEYAEQYKAYTQGTARGNK
jgi:hypothetical protein